jgi:hypothetical protein
MVRVNTYGKGKKKMNGRKMTIPPADPECRWAYRAGAVSAFLVFAGYLATIPVYVRVGNAPRTGVEAQLAYFAGHATGWWVIVGLMVGTDLLLIPLFLALYQAMKHIGRSMMLIALALKYLFVALDISVTWTAYSALIVAGGKYGAAVTGAAKAALVAGAGYPSAMIDSPLMAVGAIIIPSAGVLLTGLVMLRGVFGKPTAFLALAAGITGIAFLGSYIFSALGVFSYINALFATVWYGFVGTRLLKLSRQ